MNTLILNRRAAALFLAVLTLSGCASYEGREKEALGTVVGVGVGALIGSQFGGGKGQIAAATLGALAGGYFGNVFGKSLDEADRQAAADTTQKSLEYSPSGRTTTWSNPDSGNSGTVTPTKTYVASSGQSCREFETTIIVDGKQQAAKGKACRQSDGSWKIVE